MKGILICIMLFGFLGLQTVQSQDKAPVRIYLEHFRNADKRVLSVRILSKKDKRYRPAAGVEVELYKSEISSANLMGTLVTSEKGVGTYTFNEDQFELANKTALAKYYAVVNENESLLAKNKGIIVKTANMEVMFFGDSIWRKQIYVHVSETDSAGRDVPKGGVEIKVLVERPLSPLPVGDDYNRTDVKGNAIIRFPNDLPGDVDGNLQILVHIVENDDYGTVEFSEFREWGIPTVINDLTLRRSLWASGANAPIPLLIFVISLIVAVWYIIFYIVYKIFRIRELGVG